MAAGNVVLTRVGGTMVLTFQGAADAVALAAASEVLMEELRERHPDAAVFEISGCEVIDLGEFAALCKLVRTVEWLGVRCVIAGLRPGVVGYLVSAGVFTDTPDAALDLEQALFDISPNRNAKSR